LDAQRTITFQQVSALETRPALVAIIIATVLFLDYCCHRLPPLPQSLPCAKWRAQDGEGAPRLQSLSVSRQVCSRSSSRRDGRRGDRGRKRNVSSSCSESCTGIGVVTGFGAMVLMI